MREIKFRARNVNNLPYWIYGYFIIKNGRCSILNDDGEFQVIAESENQFTGLHDKSGKEVYEGDIVRLPNEDICEIQYKADWDYSGFLAISVTKLYDIESYKYWSGEVIGNIYENPELCY